MKKLINKIILGSLVLVSASCTGDYLEINSNPYQPGDLTADDYALGASMNNLAGCVVSADVNTAQFTDCLLGGPMGGYFADSNSGWANTISMYNAKDDWTRVFLKSDKIIPILYTNLNFVQRLSEESSNLVPMAVATIIKVAAMHRVTDTYGPIPYSKIGKDGSITTPYDSQKDVYYQFFDELSQSVKVLKENSELSLSPTADYVYGGDLKKWIKFANSLKLRLAMRLVYADLEKAKAMAEEAVNPDNGGVIESNADNAKWDYFRTSPNPIYTATRYNQADGCETGGDTHAAADIILYMNNYNDPRKDKYFVKSEFSGNDYVGLRRGIVVPASKVTRQYSGVNVKPTDPIYWMNAAEVAFLRAEGKAVFNINTGSKSPKEYYEEGVRLSFEQWGVEGVDTYLNNNYSTVGYYSDPTGENSYQQLLTNVSVKWDDGVSLDEKQERIIIQKWIANWMLGNEAWADYRRTGYPKLIPASADGNRSNGVVDSNKGARRMPFPQDEYISNKDNIQEAVTLLGGLDNMGTNVWWDCKSK